MSSDEPGSGLGLPQAVEAVQADDARPGDVPARRRGFRVRLGRRRRAMAAAGAVVAALVAGLIVWSPWTPSPPSAVRVTGSTATTAEVTWAASSGIAPPDRYLVLRDGQQVASVPAGVTSWTDQGLTPGATYAYQVAAAGWVQSGLSAAVSVTTPAPSPAGLAITHVTYSTVTLHWSPPRNAPVPDLYEIYNGPDLIGTISGNVTSYTDTKQNAGNVVQYSVTAQWGDYKSAPSAPASGELLAAPVPQYDRVTVMTTSVPGNGASLSVGYHWNDSWTFITTCTQERCEILADPDIIWSPTSSYTDYPVTLRDYGRTYSGSAQVRATRCGSTALTDTLTLTMTAKGAVVNGAWQAWTGTMVLTEPPAGSDGAYCPQQSWTFNVNSAS